MKRIGEALVEELKQDSLLNRIDYLPYGHKPEHGRLSPDLIVTLSLDSIDESGVIGRDLKATVLTGIGADFTASNRSTIDNQTPPIVRFNGTSRLEHESSLSGVESAGARYTAQGKDMAVQIGNAISGQLKQLREKHDALPQLPDGFYPPFREAPEFEFLSKTGATRLTSFHELMAHNETFWRLNDSAEPRATVELVHAELQAAGWTEGDHDVDAEKGHVRMRNGAQFVEVFPLSFESFRREDAPPSPLIVRFRDRMSADELSGAFQTLMDAGPPDIELLLGLRKYGTGPQRDQVLTLAEMSAPRSASVWLALAEWYAGQKDKDSLFRALQRAHALSFTLGSMNGQSPASEIKRLAKKHELDHDLIRQVDPAVFDELGFVRLGEDVLEGTSEIVGNSPAAFFIPDSEAGKWTLLAFHAQPLPGSRFRLTTVEASENGGRTTFGIEIQIDGPYEQSRGFKAYLCQTRIEQNDKGGLTVTLTLTPRAAKSL
jgi:hypothetical protein